MTVEEIKNAPINKGGWHVLSSGNWVKLGNNVTLGNNVKLGDGVKLGNNVTLGNWVKLGDGVKLGNWVKLGNKCQAWYGVTLGNWVTLGDEVKLGNNVTLGNGVTLGNWVKLGDEVTLGNNVTLGDGVTSTALNKCFIDNYRLQGDTHIFWKWVTKERKSPNFDGGTVVKYPVGATIEAEDAKISDQQCAPGLHVLRIGYRPEWLCLCGAEHNLIKIDVEVKTEDICFAGLPTADAKVRVKKLKVLS